MCRHVTPRTRYRGVQAIIVIAVFLSIVVLASTGLQTYYERKKKADEPVKPRRYTVEVTFSPNVTKKDRTKAVLVNLMINGKDVYPKPPQALALLTSGYTEIRSGTNKDVVRLTVYQSQSFEIHCRIYDTDNPATIYAKENRFVKGEISCWMNRDDPSPKTRRPPP